MLLAGILLFSLRAAALSPEEALRQMKVADGFTAKLVASEPEIRQPISISFDDRGRMWVIQYLQYPTPAGLKPVKVDQYLRTTYDKLPEPPPRGPKGADRITICEDTNGDGRMDTFKDFVSGLNLCSGMTLGYGGVFVAQPPYLLFYADKNHDDIPDGDPEVLLTGFGMEDAHAFANSLTWGPDGWLYGAQGSTVTARIPPTRDGIEFQQGIWRYHPVTRAFELFAEGGGNTWGLDFDDDGELIAGTNFSERMLHQLQGAYYVKNFGKHGALHNPYAYGFFDHVPFSGYKGLHISIGGIIYHGGAFGKEFEGAYIFGNTLDHAVYWANLKPHGSTFTASHGGTLLKTDDELFRPVDCTIGPDGAVYVADWCDKRATHVDPLDTWDRSNGRIYKIERTATKSQPAAFDLSKLTNDQLADSLSHTNDWFVRQALRILGERRSGNFDSFQEKLQQTNDVPALKYLWVLYVSGGFTDQIAGDLLHHPNPQVRKWTVRFLGDKGDVAPVLEKDLVHLVRTEQSPVVRAQLACSAKRLPGVQGLPIIRELIHRDEDVDDPFIPLLLWWAIEKNASDAKAEIKILLQTTADWQSPMMKKHLLERIARRFAAETNLLANSGLEACAELLTQSPSNEARQVILQGMEKSLTGKRLEKVPLSLVRWFESAWKKDAGDLSLIRLGLRMGRAEANVSAADLLQNGKMTETEMIPLMEVYGQTAGANSSAIILSIFTGAKSETLKLAVLSVLERFSAPEIARTILENYANLSPTVQARSRDCLLSRTTWTQQFLDAIDAGKIDSKKISIEQVRRMAALKNEDVNRRIEKIWGKIRVDSPAEKQNSINELKLVLHPSGVAGRDGKGNPDEGKKIFQQACAVCHKLFDEGNSIGPDLTGTDRKNTDFMLANIVNPSGYIRAEYVSFAVETKDDQIVNGLMAESTPGSVTLLDASNQRHVISREQIRELKESQTSLMPEGLLEALQPQQVMDLFSYLQKD